MHELLLLRHGETRGYHDDVGLTALGERQAHDAGAALAARLGPEVRIRLRHAPTARATATAAALLAALGRDVDGPAPDPHFDSLRFFHDGAARESSAVAAHRIALAPANGERTPDWVADYDRFDTDHGASAALGGPIDHWMTATTRHFEPPQAVVYRAWAGIRALVADAPPDSVTVVCSHSALLRAVAAAALGRDPGEPANLEQVRVVVDGGLARVGFRDGAAVVEIPSAPPPWLHPAYLGW